MALTMLQNPGLQCTLTYLCYDDTIKKSNGTNGS